MITTEAEARTKWCPFARASASHDEADWPAVNRATCGVPDPDCLCIASDCMAWRVASPLVPNEGYCGLAGRPGPLSPPIPHNDGEEC